MEKVKNISTLTPNELTERVKNLEHLLEECIGAQDDGDGHGFVKVPFSESSKLWGTIADTMRYGRYKGDSWSEVARSVREDLSLLGRVVQEVIFANMVRNSTSDFGIANNAGNSLHEEQFSDLIFFLDRLSYSLHSVENQCKELLREENQRQRERQ